MKLKKKTKITTEYWYELEYCCKKFEEVFKRNNSPIHMYPNGINSITVAKVTDGKTETFKEPKYSGIMLSNEQINFCPFCGEKISE